MGRTLVFDYLERSLSPSLFHALVDGDIEYISLHFVKKQFKFFPLKK